MAIVLQQLCGFLGSAHTAETDRSAVGSRCGGRVSRSSSSDARASSGRSRNMSTAPKCWTWKFDRFQKTP